MAAPNSAAPMKTAKAGAKKTPTAKPGIKKTVKKAPATSAKASKGFKKNPAGVKKASPLRKIGDPRDKATWRRKACRRLHRETTDCCCNLGLIQVCRQQHLVDCPNIQFFFYSERHARDGWQPELEGGCQGLET